MSEKKRMSPADPTATLVVGKNTMGTKVLLKELRFRLEKVDVKIIGRQLEGSEWCVFLRMR